MEIKGYEAMGDAEMDVIREIASIGTGSAATSLASMLGQQVRMTIPEINILGYNDTIDKLGDPEEGIAAVLTRMSGEMEGIMLFLLRLDFINEVLRTMMGQEVEDYESLTEMEISALTEVGNIIISSYANAVSTLSGITIELSVPSVAVNMLGGILSVPMAEFGYVTDKLLLIDGQLLVDNRKLNSTILMMPDIESLNKMMKKLGAAYEGGN
ncbi:MAG TPA: chemotaxis protein CheC [Candidatus Dorea gallistercoris]|uniref:Chemotaxis protein CheC n=1 Tax=Candidatus Dorea gallistercoris TaxID=2838542 RepID=A0A9D1UFM1_9FIRM|nr:chemotaxis protein CheC [Candidatus Dorea gallistercoris]